MPVKLFLVLLSLLGVLGGYLYLEYLNPGEVELLLTREIAYSFPKIGLVLLSFSAGALLVLALVLAGEVRKFFVGWQAARDQKRALRIQDLYAKALNSLLAKRHGEAMALFQRILLIDPRHVETLLRLGSLTLKEKGAEEAIRLHQRARELDGRNAEILFALATDYEVAQRWEDALHVLEEVLKIDEMNITALIRMRDLHQSLGRWEAVLETQEQIVRGALSPIEHELEHQRLLGIKYEYGRSLLEQGVLEKAKRIFRSILKLQKDFTPALLGLGEALVDAGDVEEAIELWERAFRQSGSPIFLQRLEDLYLELGEPSRALTLYREALARDPRDAPLQFFMGKLYFRLEMIDSAYETLTAVDAGSAPLPCLHRLLGQIHLRRGSLREAVEELQQALPTAPTSVGAVKIPYQCANCGLTASEWSGRCPQCGKWNTYEVDLQRTC